jgi:hypothetical protein
MARLTLMTLALAMLTVATPADAQGRDDRRNRQASARTQGVPPGQLPPAGLCRVWYDDRSPGRQPAPTDCRNAERTAARDRNARVIYGDDRDVFDRDVFGRSSRDSRYPDSRGNDRAVERNGRVRDPRIAQQDRYGRGERRYTSPAFQSGYRDGLDKGREDADDNDRFDPNRHSWYRSATRGYEDEFGSRADYQTRYREGFEAGYAEGYRAFSRR